MKTIISFLFVAFMAISMNMFANTNPGDGDNSKLKTTVKCHSERNWKPTKPAKTYTNSKSTVRTKFSGIKKNFTQKHYRHTKKRRQSYLPAKQYNHKESLSSSDSFSLCLIFVETMVYTQKTKLKKMKKLIVLLMACIMIMLLSCNTRRHAPCDAYSKNAPKVQSSTKS